MQIDWNKRKTDLGHQHGRRDVMSKHSIYRSICFGFKEKPSVKVIWVNPFMPPYPLTNSPNWSLGISIDTKLREFDKRSRHALRKIEGSPML